MSKNKEQPETNLSKFEMSQKRRSQREEYARELYEASKEAKANWPKHRMNEDAYIKLCEAIHRYESTL